MAQDARIPRAELTWGPPAARSGVSRPRRAMTVCTASPVMTTTFPAILWLMSLQLLSIGRVGGWRGGLRSFSIRPPPNRTCNFRSIRLSSDLPLWSAQDICIHSLAVLLVGRLSPFALSLAFPASLVGRHSHDYYGDCVTLGLAPFR